MKLTTLNPSRKLASVLCAIVFVIFLPLQHLSAQQQVSTFSIPGWTPGTVPVFSGAGSNVIALQFGDSLTTSVAFEGSPTDGIGTDQDNIAFQSFSYTYTLYLTPAGGTFSSASIPVGTHSISALQSCSSGTMPPWSISYDAQTALDTNNVNMNIKDGITDCIAAGDYQVDLVLNSYAVNSTGPAALPVELQWNGYANNGLTQLPTPSSSNTADVPLSPVSSYLLGQIAFVHVASPSTCPPVTLSLPGSIETLAITSSATVIASYPGHCDQNAFTYAWSDGETTATAVNLRRGTHAVTVTSPCGTSATASITISYPTVSHMTAINPHEFVEALISPEHATGPADNQTKKAHAHVETQVQLYPNPAMHHITFNFATESTNSKISIYDMLGNELMTATNTTAEAGSQKMELNIDGLPAGVYLYELHSGESVRGKFVKQ